jgi:hypothetical protein
VNSCASASTPIFRAAGKLPGRSRHKRAGNAVHPQIRALPGSTRRPHRRAFRAASDLPAATNSSRLGTIKLEMQFDQPAVQLEEKVFPPSPYFHDGAASDACTTLPVGCGFVANGVKHVDRTNAPASNQRSQCLRNRFYFREFRHSGSHSLGAVPADFVSQSRGLSPFATASGDAASAVGMCSGCATPPFRTRASRPACAFSSCFQRHR